MLKCLPEEQRQVRNVTDTQPPLQTKELNAGAKHLQTMEHKELYSTGDKCKTRYKSKKLWHVSQQDGSVDEGAFYLTC